MTGPSYTVDDLANYLDLLREIVNRHPEFNLKAEGSRYFSNDIEEKRRDMSDTLKDKDGFELSFEQYLPLYPAGTFEHAVVIYMAVDQLANRFLIDEEGGCNWENHRVLGNRGYRVRKGEGDSFGWLTGVICCDEFHHVYG